jgi:hypothetical protein
MPCTTACGACGPASQVRFTCDLLKFGGGWRKVHAGLLTHMLWECPACPALLHGACFACKYGKPGGGTQQSYAESWMRALCMCTRLASTARPGVCQYRQTLLCGHFCHLLPCCSAVIRRLHSLQLTADAMMLPSPFLVCLQVEQPTSNPSPQPRSPAAVFF